MDMNDDQCRKVLDFASPAPQTAQSADAAGEDSARTLNVFLRVRPLLGSEADQGACLTHMSATDVALSAPEDSKGAKAQQREIEGRFTYTRVFSESASQMAFFRATTLPLVQAALQGTSSLLFTYGVTNSGKTFTVQGTPTDTGVLPRALDVLFNSIDGALSPEPVAPRGQALLTRLAADEHARLMHAKQACLNHSHRDDDQSIASFLADSAALDASAAATALDGGDMLELAGRVVDATRLSVAASTTFAVFVSYAEVYNETLVDLLAPPPARGQRVATLKLATDSHDHVYLRDLREFPVASAEEALKLLNVGRRNRQVAATHSNASSSRSHCIFTIKIAVIPPAGIAKAVLSRLAIVDLAGSERYAKTNTSGQQLKEAGNINNSLLTLGRCIETLRWNQANPTKPQRMVPFRESKLTRLFQAALSGKEEACMIVNVSPAVKSYDETYHTMKFSAVARQIVTAPLVSKVDTGLAAVRLSLQGGHEATLAAMRAANAALAEQVEDLRMQCREDMAAVRAEADGLRAQLDALVDSHAAALAQQEMEIRAEMADEMDENYHKMEHTMQAIIAQQDERVEERVAAKLEIYKTALHAAHPAPSVPADANVVMLAQQVDVLRAQLQTASAAASDAAAAQRSLQLALKEAEMDMARMKEAMLAETAAASAKFNALQLELEKYIASNDDMASRLSSAQAQSARMEEQLRFEAQQKDAAIEALRRKEKTHETTISALKMALSQLEVQHSELQGQFAAALQDEASRDLAAAETRALSATHAAAKPEFNLFSPAPVPEPTPAANAGADAAPGRATKRKATTEDTAARTTKRTKRAAPAPPAVEQVVPAVEQVAPAPETDNDDENMVRKRFVSRSTAAGPTGGAGAASDFAELRLLSPLRAPSPVASVAATLAKKRLASALKQTTVAAVDAPVDAAVDAPVVVPPQANQENTLLGDVNVEQPVKKRKLFKRGVIAMSPNTGAEGVASPLQQVQPTSGVGKYLMSPVTKLLRSTRNVEKAKKLVK